MPLLECQSHFTRQAIVVVNPVIAIDIEPADVVEVELNRANLL